MPSNRKGKRIGWVWAAASVAAVLVMPAGESRADQLTIRGGGTLRGKVVPIEGRPGFVEVVTATASRPFVFRQDQIEGLVPEEGPLDDYIRLRDGVDEAADAQYEFGLWCEQRGLTGPAMAHFRRAAERDEEHGPAQKKLGRVLFDGRWMTYDERRELQGLVKHGGRWVTPEEKEDRDALEQLTLSQQSWARRIEILVKKALEGSPSDRAEAARQLREIAEPDAVVPLVNRLGREGPDLRLVLAEVLGAIDDPIAGNGLAHRILKETDERVRLATLNELARRRDPEVVPRLIRALGRDDPEEVGRAAWALAGLGAAEAVPKLIPKLVTTRRRVETVLVPAAPSGGGMGLGVNFGSAVGPGFGIGGGPSIPVLTGPAVAPGAIAFGVQAVPVLGYVSRGTGFAMGAAPAAVPAAPPVPRQVVRPYRHRDVEVLAALERLTGRNFGYDAAAWDRWLRAEFRPPADESRPERRVPQP